MAEFTTAEYEALLAQEQVRYRDVLDVNALPDIFHYWSHTYLGPMVREFEISHPDDWFANNLVESARVAGHDVARFISIGAGNCDTEVRVAKLIRQAGLTDFVIECVDINADMLARGEAYAESEGVAANLSFVREDFNRWKGEGRCSGIMANQSLHHVVELEHLFGQASEAMRDGGMFVISDIIGRNGHMRWPEALDAVHAFWRELPHEYRFNQLLRRHEDIYENWDCSDVGFEGIRAQDILPLLVEQFHFPKFIAFGNVIDPFIDRAFGHNFKADCEWDRGFIDRIHHYDETSFRDGTLKPTHIFAVATVHTPQAKHYSRGLSPEWCIRKP